MNNFIPQAFAREEHGNFGTGTSRSIQTGNFEVPGTLPDFTIADSLAQAVTILSAIAAGVAVIAILTAGIMWSAAAGDEEKIGKAKNYIKWSLFGLVLSLLAWSIVSFFSTNFSG